ncbi:hypothetical protein [Yinghuangia seranimata]|uniref:hypothetical protein n=1 Tax=Yinghuangia seranimata TaxID=408067 RepID=UPI00248C7688|nr:hypothetical protein [Yinghuangia seranimata]MDI2125806.1 hypothetical protein [Yinghuangia seranimata]
MGQWDVLGYSSDPVPGDTNQIKQLADSFRTTSDRAGIAQKQTSDARDDNDLRTNWTGEAAKAYAEHFKGVPDDLTKLHDSYKTAADALTAYYGSLVTAQAMRDSALTEATKADGDLKAAQTAKKAADGEVDAAAKNLQTIQNQATPPDAATLQAAIDRHNKALNGQTTHGNDVTDATGRLNHAKGIVKNAVDIRDKAAKTLTDALHQASKQGIKNLHWWETAIDWFYDHVVPFLKIAVAVLGVIALFVSGPLGWIVFGLALAVFATTAYEAFARHRAGVGDVVLAALDVIPGMKGLTLIGKAKFLGALAKSGKFPRILNAFTKTDGLAMKTAKFFSPKGGLKKAWDGKLFKMPTKTSGIKNAAARGAVRTGNTTIRYGMQLPSNFATKYATTLAAEHLNGNDVELWNPGAAINAAAGAVVSVGGKDLGTLFKHRVRDGKWLPGKRAADDHRVGQQRPTDQARQNTHEKAATTERAKADDYRNNAQTKENEAKAHEQTAKDERTSRETEKQNAKDQREEAGKQAKEEKSEAKQAKAEDKSAKGHENQAQSHEKAAAKDNDTAAKHDTKAAAAAKEHEAQTKTANDKHAEARGHEQTAQDKAAAAHKSDTDANTARTKAEGHENKADDLRTQAREHERQQSEHQAKADKEPNNPDHARKAAEHKDAAEQAHTKAREEDAHAKTERDAETKAKDEATTSRKEADDATKAAHKADEASTNAKQRADDADTARQQHETKAADARTSAKDHQDAAAKERTEHDAAKERADDHRKNVEHAQDKHDEANKAAKDADERADQHKANAKAADKQHEAADKESAANKERAAEADRRAERHDNLKDNKDPDGDARYTKPYHRLLDSTSDSLNTRRHWYSGGMNSMTSSVIGKAAEDYWKQSHGEQVNWAYDLTKSGLTGFAGGAGQQVVSKWQVNPGPFNKSFSGSDHHTFGVREWEKPGWQWERTAEIGVKRVAKALPEFVGL